MLRGMLISISLLLMSAPSYAGDAAPPKPTSPWDMSTAQFKDALNKAIKLDTDTHSDSGIIKTCKADPNEGSSVICSFADGNYTHLLNSFKKLNIMDGNWPLKLSLVITETKGKVSKLRIIGDRTDPANLFTFMNAVINVMQTFDPHVVDKDEDLHNIRVNLGLMRGDDANDIGKPDFIIEDWGLVECLSMPSAVTSSVLCRIVPRS